MKELIFEWVTFGIAVIGAVLGVYSSISEYRRRLPHVRLSVRWILLYFGGSCGDFAWGLALKIMNVGDVPVKIHHVGVEIKGRGFVRVDTIEVEGWGKPDRIESGDAVVVRIPRETFSGCKEEEIGRCFVELPCEKKFHTVSIRRYFRMLQSGPDNDLKERAVPTLMTVTAPENASENEKRQIENCRQAIYHHHVFG